MYLIAKFATASKIQRTWECVVGCRLYDQDPIGRRLSSKLFFQLGTGVAIVSVKAVTEKDYKVKGID